MTPIARGVLITVCSALCVTACIPPNDSRPGLWLSGEAASVPSDWRFTDTHQEIDLEVATPHFLAHSVTIWCVSVDGELFIAARDPDEKNWPGWVEDEPEVRLGIGGKVYEVELARLDDAEMIGVLRGAYAAKYDPPANSAGEGPPMRYWRVQARDDGL